MPPPPPPNPRPPDDDSWIQGRHWLSAAIERFIAAITPPCTGVLRSISESLERPLSLGARLRLRTHFVACCYCRRYEDQVRRLRRFTIALPEHLDAGMGEGLDEPTKERIKRRLREEL